MRRLILAAAMLVAPAPAMAGVVLDACAMQAATQFEPGYEAVGSYIIQNAQAAINACDRAVRAEPGPMASAWLARAYFTGGLYADALRYALEAAQAGNPLGQQVAGDILTEGLAGEADPEAGIAWLEKASAQGFAPAQTSLGFSYGIGQGVTVDEARALELYQAAADQGYGVAEANVGIFYRDGLGGLSVDLEAAAGWFKKAAAHGDAGGQDALGYAYEYGQGVAQDYAEATRYYAMAADQGNENAMGNLAFAYQEGNGVEQDYARAMELFKKADAAGSQWTASYIGGLYLDGHGVDQDLAEARVWIDKGVTAGDYNALYLMGRISEEGLGSPVDLDRAKDWYAKAVEAGSEEAQAALDRLGA